MLAVASQRGLSIDDALRRFDSYPFFKACGGLVVTGSTGTNVRDVRIVLGVSEPVSSAV
jgi:hydroxypyruvate reductase